MRRCVQERPRGQVVRWSWGRARNVIAPSAEYRASKVGQLRADVRVIGGDAEIIEWLGQECEVGLHVHFETLDGSARRILELAHSPDAAGLCVSAKRRAGHVLQQLLINGRLEHL